MKGVAVALLVATVAVAADVRCPSEWSQYDTFLAHEECHKYYMCDHSVPVEMSCCCDLYFNAKTGQCDWPANVNCEDRNIPGQEPSTYVTADTTTAEPTAEPTTAEPTTTPTTAAPTTVTPTTAAPTTATPTTAAPTTVTPTTAAPTTATPTTAAPTTVTPTTAAPTTATPTSAAPTTATPTSAAPTTATPTSAAPTTATPTSAAPTTVTPTTAAPTTVTPTTAAPTTVTPTTAAPTTVTPTTAAPTTVTPTTAAPTTVTPTTAAPTTATPTTAAPTTAAPTTTAPTTTTAEPTTPAPGFLENGCPVNPYIHWLLPVEGDCNGFYYCVWGELVRRACPTVLHFNRVLQVCDWPANAGCDASQTTTVRPSSITPSTTTPIITTPTTTVTTPAGPTTPESGFQENGCPVDPYVHWLLPVEGDCNGFYYCVWGDLVLRACPPTMHFNKQLQVCDWPAHAGCDASNSTTVIPTTSNPSTQTPTTNSGVTSEGPPPPDTGFLPNGCPVNPHVHWLLPVEGDCNGFYYCVWGDLVRRACPSTLHFNKIIQVCDWPYHAGCNATVTTTTVPSTTTTPTPTTTPQPTTAAPTTTPVPTTSQPTTAAPTTAPTTTESPDFLPNGCPVNPHVHWLLPVEGDCNGFYYCVWGELVRRSCPETLHFNKNLQVCDWPAHAGCNASATTTTPNPTTSSPTTASPTTASPTTASPTTAIPTTASPTTASPTTASPTTTPSPGFLENGCPVNPYIHWLLPVAGDCNGFYYCVWGELVQRTCPETLHFNKNLQVCDWPANAGCDASGTTTVRPISTQSTQSPNPGSTTTEITIPDEFLPNGCPVNPHVHWLLPVSGDCNGFYYCVWGELVLRACPPTLHFNKKIQVCDWPTSAGCTTSVNKHNIAEYSQWF